MKLLTAACFFLASTGVGMAADIAPMPVKAVGQSADKIWTTVVNLDVRYSSWRSDRGFPTIAPPLAGTGAGYQVYMPFGIQTSGSPVADWRFEFAARSGYVFSKQTSTGLEGQVSTLTDTALSGTATYTGWAGIVPFLSLNVNAPTGTAALYGNARFARMDPDLVDVPTFGEGWNIAPTVGVNIPINATLMFTASAGYTLRNAFDKEGDIDPITLAQPAVSFNPGDVATFNIGLTYGSGPLSANVSVAYATETTTSMNGVDSYKAGDRITVSGGAAYAWNDSWRSSVNGFWSHSQRNDVIVPPAAGLLAEAFNSNSTVYRINVDHTYTIGQWSVGPTASYLNRNNNSYSPVTFQFVPAKDRYSFGLVGGYAYSSTMSLTARVERIWTHERENTAFAIPAIDSAGWLVTAGGVIQF